MIALITLFALLSYIIGTSEVLKGNFTPSIYSRIIWLLLAINSFVGVYQTSQGGTFILATVFLIGNAAICIASFKNGSLAFGKMEKFCSLMLLVCAITWIFSDLPLLSLFVSLFAHFVGGIPTLHKTWANPKAESLYFWALFFIASLLSVINDCQASWSGLVFSLYYTCFDGLMCLLCLRSKARLA
jgi:hypothetical protein